MFLVKRLESLFWVLCDFEELTPEAEELEFEAGGEEV